MTEKLKTINKSTSLSPKDNEAFQELKTIDGVESMKSAVSNNPRLNRLVKSHFKQKNESVVNAYAGVTMKKVQKGMRHYGYDLGNTGNNGIDGIFGKNTFVTLVDLQKRLDLPVTGILDLNLLMYVIPETFRTKNREQGRSIQKTYDIVNQKLFTNKKKINRETKDRLEDGRMRMNEKERQFFKNKILTVLNNREDKRGSEVVNLKRENVKKFFRKSIPHRLSIDPERTGKMTFCSKIARKNLYEIGASENKVKWGDSAINSMKLYGRNKNYVNKLDSLPANVNALDLFIDSNSEHEHRAAAYFNAGRWYVLDPYSIMKSNKNNPKLPIPMEEYLSRKKLLGVFAHVA